MTLALPNLPMALFKQSFQDTIKEDTRNLGCKRFSVVMPTTRRKQLFLARASAWCKRNSSRTAPFTWCCAAASELLPKIDQSSAPLSQPMEIQEVDVFFASDGSVKLQVRGVQGGGCLSLTEGLEKLLGG